ncbi:MAG TPA: transglycosylase family protein [Thermoleophilaceae bacterium]|jgi:soluble lytic murein transglycosylase-like protein
MRKLVLILACTAAAIPAVALAADEDEIRLGSGAPDAGERKAEARIKGKRVRAKLERRAEKAERARERARARKRAREQGGGPAGAANGGATTPAHLQAIAACESGGNPRAVGGGGAYRGKYQFDRGTWASVGGSGDPAAASEAEQDRRAAMLYARAGSSPWPVCGS